MSKSGYWSPTKRVCQPVRKLLVSLMRSKTIVHKFRLLAVSQALNSALLEREQKLNGAGSSILAAR